CHERQGTKTEGQPTGKAQETSSQGVASAVPRNLSEQAVLDRNAITQDWHDDGPRSLDQARNDVTDDRSDCAEGEGLRELRIPSQRPEWVEGKRVLPDVLRQLCESTCVVVADRCCSIERRGECIHALAGLAKLTLLL